MSNTSSDPTPYRLPFPADARHEIVVSKAISVAERGEAFVQQSIRQVA
jgi:hypothetical protein